MQDVLKTQILGPLENPEYVKIRSNTGEEESYRKIIYEAVPLNEKSIGVHAMISKRKVLGNPTHYSMLDNKYQDSNIKNVTMQII